MATGPKGMDEFTLSKTAPLKGPQKPLPQHTEVGIARLYSNLSMFGHAKVSTDDLLQGYRELEFDLPGCAHMLHSRALPQCSCKCDMSTSHSDDI